MKIIVSWDKEDSKSKEPVMLTLENFHGQVWTNVVNNQLLLFLSESDADKIAFQLGATLQDIDITRKGDKI